MRVRILFALLLIAVCGIAAADVFRPAYLQLTETGDGAYNVVWKVAAAGQDMRLSAYVQFPDGTKEVTQPRAQKIGDAWIERWQVQRNGGFVGQTISIAGKAVGVTDVIARIERLDGSSQIERLPARLPEFVVQAPAGASKIAWSYLVLGFEHILGGIDHLLFVFALLLVVRGTKRIVLTVTAFTVAHSVTLVAATLGWIHVPGPPVEAIIALSIMFVAAEAIHGYYGRHGITARAPWVVAFSFGLLHGLGFASALAEVGLPDAAIPIALLMFNVGVELGQLAFVCGALMLLAGLRGLDLRMPKRLMLLPAYGIGMVAAFWTLERTVSFWG